MSLARMLPLILLLSGCSWVPFMGKHGDERAKHTGRDDIASVIANLPEVQMPTAVASRPTQVEVHQLKRDLKKIPFDAKDCRDPIQKDVEIRKLLDMEDLPKQ